jgi:hypothetical protein
MRLTRVVLWAVLALLAFVVVNTVVSAILTALSLIWTLVTTAVTLALLAGIAYGGYRLYRWLSGNSTDSTSRELGGLSDPVREPTRQSNPESRVDSLQQRYANGDLSEAELERRLERELADENVDSIDRELERER